MINRALTETFSSVFETELVTLVSMKRLVVSTKNRSQMDLLVRLVKELHLNYEVIDEESDLGSSLLRLAEKSFAKEWDSEEDERWDEILNNDGNAT